MYSEVRYPSATLAELIPNCNFTQLRDVRRCILEDRRFYTTDEYAYLLL
jgi:hypothetical protein